MPAPHALTHALTHTQNPPPHAHTKADSSLWCVFWDKLRLKGLKPEGGAYLLRNKECSNEIRDGKNLAVRSETGVTSELKRFVWQKDT